MLENIINNPIDTPRGTSNPFHGIALRGPLSQFFSALYLKPLDDSLSSLNIHYLRFQDDVIAFCKTKKQLNRCRRRMMEVLNERQLTLSRKKSRMGPIEDSFHFLGIHYSPTQRENNITTTHANDEFIDQLGGNYLPMSGGGVDQLLIINSMCLCKLFLILGHCERHARI
jgi:RNA-directed DNA polymerase